MLSFSSITPTTSNLSSYNYELTIANEMKTSAPKIIQAFILLLDAMSSSLLLIALIKYAGKAMPKTVATIIIISINFISTTPSKIQTCQSLLYLMLISKTTDSNSTNAYLVCPFF